MHGGPETIRTSDTWFRKPLLYPLSYGASGLQISGSTSTGANHDGLVTRIRGFWVAQYL